MALPLGAAGRRPGTRRPRRCMSLPVEALAGDDPVEFLPTLGCADARHVMSTGRVMIVRTARDLGAAVRQHAAPAGLDAG